MLIIFPSLHHPKSPPHPLVPSQLSYLCPFSASCSSISSAICTYHAHVSEISLLLPSPSPVFSPVPAQCNNHMLHLGLRAKHIRVAETRNTNGGTSEIDQSCPGKGAKCRKLVEQANCSGRTGISFTAASPSLKKYKSQNSIVIQWTRSAETRESLRLRLPTKVVCLRKVQLCTPGGARAMAQGVQFGHTSRVVSFGWTALRLN